MAFGMIIPVAYIVVVLLSIDAAEATIGMNWGRHTAQRLLPSQVVDFLLQNEVKQARVYSSDQDILEAFSGSGINLTVTIFNSTSLGTIDAAKDWVNKKAQYIVPCNIRNVFLGGYVFNDFMKNRDMRLAAMRSLQYLQTALNEAGFGDQVKATFLHHNSVLNSNRTKPSETEFVDEIKEDMVTFLNYLKENRAPFVIELFPIVETAKCRLDPSFAFPDNESTQVVTDINGAVYTDIFAYMFDSFAWALQKVNASDLKIIVGQIGWPTDGYPSANVTNAERFYKSFLPLVASNRGTPMRPGAPIDTYLQSLTDENRTPARVAFMRHWGIYRTNGEPKYKIDLSGRGRDISPTIIRGLMRMPERWCLFNENTTDIDFVKRQFTFACDNSDCTCLVRGGSCSKLRFEQNISYAFNMYFQLMYQDEKACDFGGLGFVSLQNPSTDECVFPVEVVRGQQNNFMQPPIGEGFRARPNYATFFVLFLVSILRTLFWN